MSIRYDAEEWEDVHIVGNCPFDFLVARSVVEPSGLSESDLKWPRPCASPTSTRPRAQR
jgi:hypothetical protein